MSDFYNKKSNLFKNRWGNISIFDHSDQIFKPFVKLGSYN